MAEPRNPTIPGSREGFNCLLSVAGYGKRVVRCLSIYHGIDISSSQDETRDAAAFYTLNVTASNFFLGLTFLSRAERETFSRWCVGWARAVSANQPVGGYMRVQVPARRFNRSAVLQGGLVFGDAIGTVSYPLTLRFIGADDPVSAVGSASVSEDSFFQTATRDTVNAPYFYPAYYVNGRSGDAPDSVLYDRDQAAHDAKVLKGIGTDIGQGLADVFIDPLADIIGGG